MLYFEVEDVDQRYSDLIDVGIVFDSPPTSEPWLWREARFRDPGGRNFVFSPPEKIGCRPRGGLKRKKGPTSQRGPNSGSGT